LPEIKVLMLSVHDDDARIVAAVQAGACGYILKDADHKEFLRIIRGTYEGESVISPFMPDRFARAAYKALGQGQDHVVRNLASLTERELEILAFATAGKGNKEIADQLCVSLDTVKTHLHHVYDKLGVSGRVEAILLYLNSK
ncbi:MAG: LuxR C-terminal-related transcriptional regulator, partial [Nitrospiraceae bacterium]